jgi:hypothetical protein
MDSFFAGKKSLHPAMNPNPGSTWGSSQGSALIIHDYGKRIG